MVNQHNKGHLPASCTFGLTRLIFSLGLIVLMLSPLDAQTNVGRISGTVLDSSEAPVPGCKVAAVNTGTTQVLTVETDGSGLYVFPSLVAGVYDLVVNHEGFQRTQQTGVVLDASSRRTVDFRLQLGAVTESVSVSASAQQVETASGEVSRVINDTQVSQIALNGRNYVQLLQLSPGTTALTLDPSTLNLSTTGQSINGIRTQSISFTLDGGRNVDEGQAINQIVNPNIDAIAEVKVNTSSYAAEFGGRSGASLTVVTKSGTQEFHGTLYEFVRNSAFGARSFFDKQIAPLRFNDFGWTIGGPVFIPKKWNIEKNKLFFFYGEEWKYNHTGVTNLTTVPTLAVRQGNFLNSGLPAPIDPLNGTPFPNQTIPASRFSFNGPLMLKAYPAPNFGGPGGNNVVTGVNVNDPREELIRLDYYLSANSHLTYRWTHDNYVVLQPFGGSTVGLGSQQRSRPGYVTSLTFSQTLSPTAINYFSFSANANYIHGALLTNDLDRSALGLTIPGIYPSKIAPSLTISGFTGYGPGDRNYAANVYFNWSDDFSKVVGSHTLKFGGLVSHGRRTQNVNGSPEQGQVTFNTSALNTTGNAVADVLLGNFQKFYQVQTVPIFYGRYNEFGFYAQDSWKVSRKLSVEFGLRYSLFPPTVNILGNNSEFVPGMFNPAKVPSINPSDGSIIPGTGYVYNGIAMPGSSFPSWGKGRLPQYNDPSLQGLFAGIPFGAYDTNKNDWEPRLGIAYDLFGNGKTAIRTGFGTFHDRLMMNNLMNLISNPPFLNSANVVNGNIDNPAGGVNKLYPPNVEGFSLHLKDPYVISWNFGVQQQLPGDVILETNYVGNEAHHMQRVLNLNQLPVGTLTNPSNKGINQNALRPYLGYGEAYLIDNGDNSNYNALQVSVSRRMRKGISFGANYTFSKTLDDSQYGGIVNLNAGTVQNNYNGRPDYGLSSIHRANVLNFNYVYELPFFQKSGKIVLRKALGGWGLAGITSFQSGAPNSVTVPVDIAGIGVASSRASVIGAPNLPSDQRTLSHWFNTAAFLPSSKMTPGQFGNSGRNILIGPGFQVWNISIIKNTPFAEKRSLQFRAESFNTLNHPNFTGINTTVNFDASGNPTQNFGAVTGAGPGRVLSFGLKLLF
jgi:hypothetical protein